MIPEKYLLPWLISNMIAILLLLLSWKWPRLARLSFSLLFFWAAITNLDTADRYPNAYLAYAELSFLPIYRSFINGWFGEHIFPFVATIAFFQAMMAVSFWTKGLFLRTGIVGAIIFLLCIAPLGVGAAFPFSLTTIVGLLFLYRRKDNTWLWKPMK